ncbi:MAG: ImmA/IrrE family metallo-endopeptidase [Nocardioides sp.]
MMQLARPALLRRVCLGATAAVLSTTMLVVPAAATATDSGPADAPTASSAFRLDTTGENQVRGREANALLAELTSDLPADWEARLAEFNERTGADRRAVDRARLRIDPNDYVCDPAGTDFDTYLARILREAEPTTVETLGRLGIFDYATSDAIIFGTGKAGYRLKGTQGRKLVRTMGKLRRFWDIEGTKIRLMGMDSSMLMDRKRVARVAALAYGVKKKKSLRFARKVIKLIKSDPALREGRNPIFTLNAVAISREGRGALARRIGKRIVFGAGMMKANKYLGYVTTGNKAILAHEYGHQIQFARGLIGNVIRTAEKGRRAEMMADTFAAYFLGHRRGLRVSATQRKKATDIFYQVGDCAFDDPGHHGTPLQRAKAASYGFTLAKASKAKIRKSRWVAKRFDAKLPTLVAPDAP